MVIYRKLWQRSDFSGAYVSLPRKLLAEAGIALDATLKIVVDQSNGTITLEAAK